MASENDIPETGAIFTFGRSRFAGNEPSRFWVRNDRILHLACGDEHTALVTESGRIFTFGLNEWGQLGLGDTSSRDKPSCIKDLKKEKVLLVACGRSHTIVTTESGQLYTFGCNGEGQLGLKDIDKHTTPIQVDSFPTNTKFKMVAAGVDHSVCLTESGNVYVWGGNSEGQLGTGNNDDIPVPTLLSVGEPVTAIGVGYYHTALLTEKGSVFVFGEVDSGKLGLGNDIKSCQHPQKLSLGGDCIQAVSCGGSHTVLLTDKKEVYTCGNGENGQLGHGTSKQQISIPEKLNLPFKVTAICCGENHTAFLSDDGYLYTCGDGRHGKLGHGKDSYSNQFQPSRLLKFDPFIVDKVACGGCHMMVLAHLRSIPNGDTVDGALKLSLEGNQTPLDNSLDLSGSLSARDRRRQTTDSSLSSLNRTLPLLSGKTFSLLHNNPDDLRSAISPTIEVRHLPTLKNSLTLGTKTDITENGDKKENKSAIHLNADEQKHDNKNNDQAVKNLSEIPKPKVAPRTLKPVESRNGTATIESGSSDSVEEKNHLSVVDAAKTLEEKNKDKINDHIENIEDFANHKKPILQTNGFSPRLSNGNAVSSEIKVVEDESPISLSQEKKKKKKKKKEEKGKVKTKDKEKKKSKEPSEIKGETLESDDSEGEELELKEIREIAETKPKKIPKKKEKKKTNKLKEKEKKSKEESEEEEEEDEDEEEEEESETEKKDEKKQNSLNKKNSKNKGGEKLKGKKEEENDDDDDDDDSEEEEESEGVNKKQKEKKKKKKTKDDDDDDDDEKEKEKAGGDPINKLVFAEDLQPKPENSEDTTNRKSNTCSIL